MKAPLRPSRNEAEVLAIQVLAFVAEEPWRLSRFLGMTGIAVEQIRVASREEGFLAGVLDHMLADESLLVAFAVSANVDPAAIERARSVLGCHKEP